MKKVLTVAVLTVALIGCEETSHEPRPVAPQKTVTVDPGRPESHTSRVLDAAPKTLPWKPERPPLHTPKKRPAPAPVKKAPVITTISGYRSCPTTPQACIDAGSLTLYAGSKILGGHDYNGYAYLAQLPVGRTVRVTSGAVAGTYTVIGHRYLPRQGGSIPGYVYTSDLTLQSCQGSGTAFSLLRKVA